MLKKLISIVLSRLSKVAVAVVISLPLHHH